MPIINQVVKGGGTTPTGTKNITANGVYDVTTYASADVQVPTTAPAYYIERLNENGTLKRTTQLINLNGITNIGDSSLAYEYSNLVFPSNTNIDLSSLTSLSFNRSCYSLFSNSTGINSVIMGNIEKITGAYALSAAFSRADISNIDLGKLVVASADSCCSEMCYGCNSLYSFYFLSLKNIVGNSISRAFNQCLNLQDVYFSAIMASGTFSYRNELQTLLNSNVNGCTIHFPANLDPQGGSTVISSLYGYPNFGGTNTVLVFDLPSTLLLTGANSQVYERSPKYDTVSALAWRKQDTGTSPNFIIDWTPFYTSTTNDPQVGDTIYSDSACTTAVTTVASIS